MSSSDVTPEILAKYNFLINTPGYTRFKLPDDPAEVVRLHSRTCLWLGIPTVWEENGFVYPLPPPLRYEDVRQRQSHNPQLQQQQYWHQPEEQQYRHQLKQQQEYWHHSPNEPRLSGPAAATTPRDSVDQGYRIRGTANHEIIDLTDSPSGQRHSHHDIPAAHVLSQTAFVQADHRTPIRQTMTLAERINFPTGHPDAWVRSLVRKADERMQLNTHMDNYAASVPSPGRVNQHIRSTRVKNRGGIQKPTRHRPYILPEKRAAFNGRRLRWDRYLPDYRTYGGPARHRTPPHRLERIWIPRRDCYRPDYIRNPWMGRRAYPRTIVCKAQTGWYEVLE